MKRFFLFFLASVILVGCSDDPSLILAEALKREAREKQEQSVQPGIEFSSEFDAAPVVPGESAETPVYFKSNLEWKAETTSSWFSISPKSGKSGDGSVVIKTQANEEFDTRSGKITFTSGYKTFTITVVQSPKSAIILEKDSFEVGKDGGTVTVVAKTTVGFETVVPSDYLGWIGVEPYTKALETRYVQLNIAKNDGPERAGYVDLVNKEKGLSKRVSIKQDAGGIEVTGVSLDKTELTITVGDPGVKLVATVTPDNATDKTVNWASDKAEVATVDNQGSVHAVAPGEAIITVTTTDGSKTATCTVTVKTPVTTFKAVYDTNGGVNTLRFYYNGVDYSGEGITVYEDGTDKFLFDDTKTDGAKWGYNDNRGEIKSVVIDASVAGYKGLTSTASMFQGMDKATNISGAEYLDVSNVTDMSFMFNNFGGGTSGSPTTLNVVPDVSKWNTGNVTNMTGMFESYGNFSSSLDKVPDVSGWKTGKVTDMADMFNEYGRKSTVLNTVPDVSGWNTSNVTTMTNMFQNYGYSSTALSTVPNVSGWNTSNVTKISNLFNDYGHTSNNIDCTLDLSGWDLSKITGNNGENVFNFNPSTFNITIPAKTGDKLNEGGVWYYGDGTNSIAPPTGKNFTPAAPTISTIADVLATAGDNAPSATNHWYDTKGNYIYVDGGNLLVYVSSAGGSVPEPLKSTVTPNGDNYLYSEGVLSFTFNMTEGVLTSIYVDLSVYGVNDTFSPAPAAPTFDENPFEPGNIKALQTLTIKGKNLDLVTKVVFCNNVEVTNFKSQSSEQIVIEHFPATARTGKVTLVNGTTSQEVTSDMDLVVALPSVTEIYQFTGVIPYQQLTIEGENFDLVIDAIIGDGTILDYMVSNEGHTIKITMPEEVHDCTVKVTTASGVEVTVATVTAASAAGVSGNGTEQYKNNSNPDWFN